LSESWTILHAAEVFDSVTRSEDATNEETGKKEGKIKRVLAAHYGFREEELDFPSSKLRTGILDITYRMGRDAEAEDE
jgi:hypothetical protein